MKKFTGCGTALVTPFRDGSVDFEAFGRLVGRQVEAGIDFLVPLGTSGETPCLSDGERKELLRIAREKSGGRKILAGVGTNSVSGTLSNIRMLDDADAFLVVVPFYNKPGQRGIYAYFKAIAESTDKPVVLYNVPGRTGANMIAETTLRLAEIPNIVAVKEASGNIDQILEIVRNAPSDFTVLSGNDEQTLPLMAGGADGVISVASNIDPHSMTALVKSLAEGDFVKAKELNFKLMPLFKACFVESNPIPAKCGLSQMGFCSSEMRLPLTEASEATARLMSETLKELNLL